MLISYLAVRFFGVKIFLIEGHASVILKTGSAMILPVLYPYIVVSVKNFFRDKEGATSVEYGLMEVLIAIVSIVAVTLLGTNLSSKINQVATSVGKRR